MPKKFEHLSQSLYCYYYKKLVFIEVMSSFRQFLEREIILSLLNTRQEIFPV